MKSDFRAYMPQAKQTDWGTPLWLFRLLDDQFHFGLDAAASEHLHLCSDFIDEKENALKVPWSGRGVVFVNPPYGKQLIDWLKKASMEAKKKVQIVMLLPVRTDTAWFHDFIYGKKNVRIEFLRGRLKFVGSENSAPFPNMLVYFNLSRGGVGVQPPL